MTLRLVVYHIKMNDSLKVIRKIFPFKSANNKKTPTKKRKKTNEKYLFMYIHISVRFCREKMQQIHIIQTAQKNYDTNT